MLREPDFDFKSFLMIRARLVVEAILGRAEPPALKPFLKRGLMIRAFESFDAPFERGREQCPLEEGACGGEAGVEIDGAENCFVSVGEQPPDAA